MGKACWSPVSAMTDLQPVLPSADYLFILGKSICAHPLAMLELEEVGSILLACMVGGGHQKFFFYQDCIEGRGDSSKEVLGLLGRNSGMTDIYLS